MEILEITIKALEIARIATGNTSVPGLSVVLDSGLSIARKAQEIRNTRDDCRVLAERAAGLTLAVFHQLEDSSADMGIKDHVGLLLHNLQDIENLMDRRLRAGTRKRILFALKHGSIDREVKKLTTKFEDSFRIFMVQTVLDYDSKINTLTDGNTRMMRHIDDAARVGDIVRDGLKSLTQCIGRGTILDGTVRTITRKHLDLIESIVDKHFDTPIPRPDEHTLVRTAVSPRKGRVFRYRAVVQTAGEVLGTQMVVYVYPEHDDHRFAQAMIVTKILESAHEDTDIPSHTAFLKDAALVCKTWALIAQKLLFRNVILTSETAAISFQQAVIRATPKGCQLGDTVIRMKVVLDQKQRYHLSHKSFARAVSLCPNLYELRVSLYGEVALDLDVTGSQNSPRLKRLAPSFDRDTLDVLRAGPRISVLRFCNWSDNNSALFQLLDVWSSLTTLDIGGTTPQLQRDDWKPFPCTLHKLRTNFQSSPSMNFMHWLLHNSLGSLRVLDLAREPSPDLLEYLISGHGATLESLALPTCGTHGAAAVVQRCVALRELKIESAWVAPMLYKSLPCGLRHLAFTVDGGTALHPVVEAIEQSTDIRVITMHIWYGGDKHPLLHDVQKSCRSKGLELRQTSDILLFRAIIRGDPIPTSTNSHPAFP